jgi:hypothetical protein
MSYQCTILSTSSTIQLPISGDALSISSKQLWKVAKQMRKSIAAKCISESRLAVALASAGSIVISARKQFSANDAHAALMTNWGVSPLKEQYDAWRCFEVIPLLRALHVNLRLCMAATTNRQLTLSFQVQDRICPDADEAIETYADSVIENIRRMVDPQ